MSERSRGDCGSWYRSAIARTRAAKPAAEEARPAAVGKLFVLARRRGWVDSFGRVGSESSREERRERRARRQAMERGVVRGWGWAFMRRVSEGG